MKTILLIAFATCTLIPATTTATSKDPVFINKAEIRTQFDAFERFNVHRQQNGVALSWNFVTSSEIVHFVIEKSYDGNYFEVVDRVSEGAKGLNRYFDGNVYPGFIYYRVTAVLSSGTTIPSPIDMVRLVSKK